MHSIVEQREARHQKVKGHLMMLTIMTHEHAKDVCASEVGALRI